MDLAKPNIMTRLEKGIQSNNAVTRAPVLHLEFSVHTYIHTMDPLECQKYSRM
jgi:hypothetical protein